MTKRKFLFTAINYRYIGMLGGALIMLSFLSGCATQRGAGSTTTTTIEKDSSDVKVEIRTEYVTDTVFIEIPAQKSEWCNFYFQMMRLAKDCKWPTD